MVPGNGAPGSAFQDKAGVSNILLSVKSVNSVSVLGR
jgi:hypothetical protein